MKYYDYREGKIRINEILDQSEENKIREKVPIEQDFHFDNGYLCWISSIFVDIRDSTTLFETGEKSTISKVIRCFTSEVIEILNTGSNVKEIGIRGDCVYGIFSTPEETDIYEVVDRAACINTLMNMLNKLFKNKNMPQLAIGIGISSAQDLVVKAGREGSGINSKVWIGKAVVQASNLSSYGNKKEYRGKPIAISKCTYEKIEEKYLKKYGDEMKNWFTPANLDGTNAYMCNLTMKEMADWINKGMPK